jgi:hypothetical protein
MSLSVFEYRDVRPDDNMLEKALLGSKGQWDALREHIRSEYGDVSEEWKYYSKATGWSFVIKSGKRTLIYLIPVNGYFKANFVFGEGAVNAAIASGIPDAIKKTISDAKQYAEGRAFMVDAKNAGDKDAVIELIRIKDRN